MTSNTLQQVADYYSTKLAEHGECARGVDWNGHESQFLRFSQLSKIIEQDAFSVNDIGCGYGAMVDYFNDHYTRVKYHGYDVSGAMVKAAQAKHPGTSFHLGSRPSQPMDYSVASGIFNVRLNTADDVWLTTIKETLDTMRDSSTKGFSFNCLTSYSDAHLMRDHLYYADPLAMFDYCKRRFSRNVALLHDYGLYEFTILVRLA